MGYPGVRGTKSEGPLFTGVGKSEGGLADRGTLTGGGKERKFGYFLKIFHYY